MNADLILAAMLALVPHQDAALLGPTAEAIAHASNGSTETATLLAIWVELGFPLVNPFGLSRTDRNLVWIVWETHRTPEPIVRVQAEYVVQLFRGSLQLCGAHVSLAARIGYMRGVHGCTFSIRDRVVADRVPGILPLLQRSP